MPASEPRVAWREAWRFWLKLGCLSFGGPAGQIALMHTELVERRRWISEQGFLHALNYCLLLPGPEAQQLATYLGWLLHKTWGGVVAGVLFVLPSLVLLIALSWLYLSFGKTPLVSGVFYSLKPAIMAIVLHAAYRLGSRTLKNARLASIAVTAFIAVSLLHVPFPWVVLGAALVGYGSQRWLKKTKNAEKFLAPQQPQTSLATPAEKPLLNDDSPSPAHTHFSVTKFLWVIFIGLMLWAVPLIFLTLHYGWHHTFTQLSWFFTKAALLTFGGAYAVLPYVYQAAVEHYHWLSAAQMMDGLALGESTPGPLIMVVAFVGFVAGHSQALLGEAGLFWSGTCAALLATWFTFLPSFIFILAGAPLVERSRAYPRLGASLNAISAAVVGVMLSLACFFAQHTFWPGGFSQAFDVQALLLAIAATLALWRYRLPVVVVIVGTALAFQGITFIAQLIHG